MFIVKRLGRNGMWNAVSLIDENGSFRGEARFETKRDAEDYLAVYLDRMETRLGKTGDVQVKVFDESAPIDKAPKVRKQQKQLKKTRVKRKK